MKLIVDTQANSPDPIITGRVSASAGSTVGEPNENGLSSLLASPTESTQISISNAFKAIQTALSTGSTYDTDKVNALKTAIDAGQYNVDAGMIANSLIAAATELLK